jgi:hypothetical protein
MKRYIRHEFLVLPLLLFSLFIYLFYRPETTVVHKLYAIFFTPSNEPLNQNLRGYLPLNEFIIYSLPEALWVISATILSRRYYVIVYRKTLSLLYLPLVYSITLEILQYLKIFHGYFDWWDIIFSTFGWLVIYLTIPTSIQKSNFFKKIDAGKIAVIIIYLILYLSHVTK